MIALEGIQLSHRFGGVLAVQALDLQVEEGRTLAVIGPEQSQRDGPQPAERTECSPQLWQVAQAAYVISLPVSTNRLNVWAGDPTEIEV